MFERMKSEARAEAAKAKMKRVLDHFLWLLELHENNAIIAYSPTLAGQIPPSFAAHAFNTFRRGLHSMEVIRLCALWDKATSLDRESIPTAIELLDAPAVLDVLAEEVRSHWANIGGYIINPSDDPELAQIERDVLQRGNERTGEEHAAKAREELSEAIAEARALLASPRMVSLRNARDKYLAHSLETTTAEKAGKVEPVKPGAERELLEATIPIIERLYRWTNADFSVAQSREIDRKNAHALWGGCTFEVLR